MARKRSRVRERARRAGSFIAKGWGGTAVGALTGAAAYHLQMMAAQKSETVAGKWYLAPVAMAVGGHFLKRRPKLANVGAALVGVGGYSFELNRALNNASTTQSGNQGAAETQGVDTGALVRQSGQQGFLPPGNVVPFPTESPSADVTSALNLGRRRR